MKWRRISGLLLISVLLPVLRVSAEGTEHSFQLSLREPVEGMTYALYEDAACRKPLENENGENIVLVTDENGKAETLTDRTEFYLKHVQTVSGWYQEKNPVYVKNDSLQLQAHPVSYEFSETENGESVSAHLQLLNEKDEVVADWKTEKASGPQLKKKKVILEAGKSYTLRDPDTRQWKRTEDTRFEIPRYYDADQNETVSIIRKSYGRMTLKTRDSSSHTVQDISFRLYEDEKGTKQAADIDGKKDILQADEKGLIKADLYPGTYYARIENLDMAYYMDDSLFPCKVRETENTVTEIPVKEVFVNIGLKGSDGKKANGTLTLSGGGETRNVTPSVVHLKRNTDYVLHNTSHPAGYHAGKDISFHTPEKDSGQQEAVMLLPSFEVSGRIRDEETGEILKGGVFQITDVSGREVTRFSSGEVYTSDLQDESSYTIHCVSIPKGYLKPEDQRFEIGSEGNATFEVTCRPYVFFSMKAVSETDEKSVLNVRWSLYEDPECRNILKDVHGREMHDMNGIGEIHNGTYYGKVTTDDPRYYPDHNIYEIHVNHGEKTDYEVHVSLTRADLEVHVCDQNGKAISGTEIDVLNENGNVAGSFTSGEKNRLTSLKMKDDLIPGSVFWLEIRKAPGLYTWKDQRTRVVIPAEKPDEIPSVDLCLNPYVSLEVSEANEKKKTSGSTYVLYEDENCTRQAMDIHGHKAKDTTDREGRIQWYMRPGTYWLKETEASSPVYLNEVPVKVVLDPQKAWYEKQNFATVVPVIHFSTVDTQGRAVSGGSYEIQDENGETVHTFQAGGTTALQGKWLRPGKTIVIHETRPASGYQKHETDIRYTLPKSVPDKIPEIRIHCMKNVYSASSPVRKGEKQILNREEKSSFPWILPVALIGISGLIIILKILSKKNEKQIKKI